MINLTIDEYCELAARIIRIKYAKTKSYRENTQLLPQSIQSKLKQISDTDQTLFFIEKVKTLVTNALKNHQKFPLEKTNTFDEEKRCFIIKHELLSSQ